MVDKEFIIYLLKNLAYLILVLGISWSFAWLTWYIASKWLKDNPWFNSAYEHVRSASMLSFAWLGMIIYAHLLDWQADIERPLQLFLVIIGYLLAAWTLMKLLKVLSVGLEKYYDINRSQDNLHERKVLTQLMYLRRIGSIIIIGLVFSLILLEFENVRQLGMGLLTSAGVAGIIIGFAAQKSIANLLAGFQIAFTQPIRIDDVVIVEGEFGRVEEITLTYVVVKVWDQRRIILPITYFIEQAFQNWTRTRAELTGTVFLYVDYQVPIEALRQELERLLADNPLWDGRLAKIQLTNSTEKSVELRVLVSAKNASDTWDLRCWIREKLILYLQSHYPEALPQSRFTLKSPAG